MLHQSSRFLRRAPRFHFGTNEKLLKIRMKAVGNIAKITKAMKMVASSKMRSDINRLVNGRDFGVHVMPTIFAMDPYGIIRAAELAPIYENGKHLVIPITTDKGLCGGINSNMVRTVKELVHENREKYAICCIGDKGSQAMMRPFPDLLKMSLSEVQIPLTFYNIAAIADTILNAGLTHDRIMIIYNHFVNSMKTDITHMKILGFEEFKKICLRLTRFCLTNPDKDVIVPYFYSLYFSSKPDSFMCGISVRFDSNERYRLLIMEPGNLKLKFESIHYHSKIIHGHVNEIEFDVL